MFNLKKKELLQFLSTLKDGVPLQSLYGRKLVFVDRFYPSSKTCNYCGYVNKKLKLSDRQWVCPDCGEIIERDYNAALNIRDEGIRLIS